jgi:Zn-dependent protease with chaperone function
MDETQLDPRRDFGDWLHEELVWTFAGETEAWARERVARVMARLNAARPDGEALVAEILWVPDCNAFTMSGKYLYISRRLLERLPSDDAVAFVLGHETGHHDCGHLKLFSGWADWIPRARSAGYIAALIRVLEHRAYGPAREAEADLYGLALALDAGYDGDLALRALMILENDNLDHGDYDGVFGPENLLDPTDPKSGSPAYQLQRWIWTHTRGYLPLRERQERARAWLAERRKRGSSR